MAKPPTHVDEEPILNNIFPQHVYPELTINKDLDSSNMWRVKVTLNIVHPITKKTIHSPVKFIYTDWKKNCEEEINKFIQDESNAAKALFKKYV